jgi:hypothetical protein
VDNRLDPREKDIVEVVAVEQARGSFLRTRNEVHLDAELAAEGAGSSSGPLRFAMLDCY